MTPMPWVELTSEVARIAPGVLAVFLIGLALGVGYVVVRGALFCLSLWRYEKRSAQRAHRMSEGLGELAAHMEKRAQRLEEGLCPACGLRPHVDGRECAECVAECAALKEELAARAGGLDG